jgi:hypothetical protein
MLSPLDRERQEKWAQSQIARSGVCPEGYDWEPSDGFGGGYLCGGRKHFVSHGLIGEGLGGVFLWSGWPEEDEIYVSFFPIIAFVFGVGCVDEFGDWERESANVMDCV